MRKKICCKTKKQQKSAKVESISKFFQLILRRECGLDSPAIFNPPCFGLFPAFFIFTHWKHPCPEMKPFWSN
jgi:hypothetical protein